MVFFWYVFASVSINLSLWDHELDKYKKKAGREHMYGDAKRYYIRILFLQTNILFRIFFSYVQLPYLKFPNFHVELIEENQMKYALLSKMILQCGKPFVVFSIDHKECC